MQDIYIGTLERYGCPTIFTHNLISINVCLYHTAYRERGLLLKGLLWRGLASAAGLVWRKSGFQQWRYTDNLLFRSAIKCLLLPVSMTLMSLHVSVGSLSTFQISSGLILLGFFFFFW